MTREEAIVKALDWEDLHTGATEEENAGCFSAAENMRIEAADIETELRAAGYEAFKLVEEERNK